VLALLALTGAAASPSAAQQQLPKDFKDLKLDLEKYKSRRSSRKKSRAPGSSWAGRTRRHSSKR
jgi:hypothetical protein